MADDRSPRATDDFAGVIPDSAETEAVAVAVAVAEESIGPETLVVEAGKTKIAAESTARLARWKLIAARKLGHLFTRKTATSVVASTDDAHAEPAAAQRSPLARCWDQVKQHQGLCAFLLVAAVAAGVFASGQFTTDTKTADLPVETPSMAFDEIEVLPPEKIAPRETTANPGFKQAQPIQTAEHEAGPRLDGPSFGSGPSLSGPSLNSTTSRQPGRGAWLTGTIESVSGNAANIRQIGHVDLPASNSSAQRR